MSAKAPVDPIRKFLETARHQISVGNLTGAAQTLNDARQRAPRDPRLFVLASLMAEKSGNLQGALDAMQRAAEQCAWLREMVDEGDIYHPLRWLPSEAFQFLSDLPKLEAAGKGEDDFEPAAWAPAT